MYSKFSLVLMVNHACNLACSYCYTGRKFNRSMTREIAQKSIRRACASMFDGGALELSFFGGEPLIEAELILEIIEFASAEIRGRGLTLQLSMTSNGTFVDRTAWKVLTHSQMAPTISFDFTPDAHDHHRPFVNGQKSSALVLDTMRRLHETGKQFSVISVVRPTTLDALSAGLLFLRERDVEMANLSLDLWTTWSAADRQKLELELSRAADVWLEGLPRFGVNWFNLKTVELCKVPVSPSLRCGFGRGEIAIAPSGNLYPCERLIGEDLPENPARLFGHALDDGNFAGVSGPVMNATEISSCGLSCECSNFVRSGCTSKPDDLLLLLDQVCERETARVLQAAIAA